MDGSTFGTILWCITVQVNNTHSNIEPAIKAARVNKKIQHEDRSPPSPGVSPTAFASSIVVGGQRQGHSQAQIGRAVLESLIHHALKRVEISLIVSATSESGASRGSPHYRAQAAPRREPPTRGRRAAVRRCPRTHARALGPRFSSAVVRTRRGYRLMRRLGSSARNRPRSPPTLPRRTSQRSTSTSSGAVRGRPQVRFAIEGCAAFRISGSSGSQAVRRVRCCIASSV